MNPIPNAIRLKYNNNVLHCNLYRSRKENLRACLEALAMITGLTVEELERDINTPGVLPRVQVDAYSSS